MVIYVEGISQLALVGHEDVVTELLLRREDGELFRLSLPLADDVHESLNIFLFEASLQEDSGQYAQYEEQQEKDAHHKEMLEGNLRDLYEHRAQIELRIAEMQRITEMQGEVAGHNPAPQQTQVQQPEYTQTPTDFTMRPRARNPPATSPQAGMNVPASTPNRQMYANNPTQLPPNSTLQQLGDWSSGQLDDGARVSQGLRSDAAVYQQQRQHRQQESQGVSQVRVRQPQPSVEQAYPPSANSVPRPTATPEVRRGQVLHIPRPTDFTDMEEDTDYEDEMFVISPA